MEGGAMGVQITVSGKLRGDRSAFEKHTQGILPRAGNYAKNLVSEDITHTKTAMGLIGIKIRIATKEKLIPEFQLNESSKIEKEEIAKTETEQIKTETEEIAKTETEQIKIEEEKMKTLVTLEEEEEKLK
jgi:small subunit ribosomal protein S3